VQTGVQSTQSYLDNVSLIENRFETVDWTHDWSYSFRTRAVFTHLNSEFIGTTRVDNINTGGLEANYRASQRWMWLAGTSYSHRSSNGVNLDYKNTSVFLGLQYSR
jgi:hypothetical protein